MYTFFVYYMLVTGELIVEKQPIYGFEIHCLKARTKLRKASNLDTSKVYGKCHPVHPILNQEG